MEIINFNKILFLLLIIFVPALTAKDPVSNKLTNPENFFEQVDHKWIENEYWFRGKAEVNFYQSNIMRYGTPRETKDVVHILVTEKHDPGLLVKADNWQRPGLLNMLKFNYVVNYQTGIYNYHQLMSVFFDQADLRTAKMTFGSQEWCGNSFKEMVNFKGKSSLTFNTYWDGQGNGKFEVNFPEDLVLYDALPVQLRMLKFKTGLIAKIQMLPTQFSSKISRPNPEEAVISVKSRDTIQVRAGEFACYRVEVAHSKGVDRLWFEAQFPHRLLLWEAFSGNRFELIESKNLAYWQLNKPGDEKYLPDSNEISDLRR